MFPSCKTIYKFLQEKHSKTNPISLFPHLKDDRQYPTQHLSRGTLEALSIAMQKGMLAESPGNYFSEYKELMPVWMDAAMYTYPLLQHSCKCCMRHDITSLFFPPGCYFLYSKCCFYLKSIMLPYSCVCH